MKRAAAETIFFDRLPEPVVNPYIGFTSYQKFRGDPLFPDIVVRPENNMTETELTEVAYSFNSVPYRTLRRLKSGISLMRFSSMDFMS